MTGGPQVEKDVPHLAERIRKLIFDALAPFRMQHVEEQAKLEKKRVDQLQKLQATYVAAQAQIEALQAELAEARRAGMPGAK